MKNGEEPVKEGHLFRLLPCPKGMTVGFCLQKPCNRRKQCRQEGRFTDRETEVYYEILPVFGKCGPTISMEAE